MIPVKKISTAFILALFVFAVPCCSAKTSVSTHQNSTNITSNDKEYMNEGFIDNNIYQIIIVEPKEYVDSDNEEYIKKAATKRALISLERYLKSNNTEMDRNTRAILLNLIENNGELKMCIVQQESRNVHSFRIKKDNLRQYLDNITSQK